MKKILDRSWLSSVNLWTLAFLLLVFLYILPIWVFKYFPTQDGANHIENAFILRHYNDPEYVFNEFYDIRKSPIPNWTSHVFMMLSMYLVPPLIAEKLFLTGYIVLMAGGMLYLLNAVERGRTPLVFIGFPFIYNLLLQKGFYNCSLSLALLMPIIGYWWKHYKTFSVKNMIVLGLLLVVMYFCHLLYLAFALFSITTVAILSLVPRFNRWKQSLLSLLCMLPSIGLTLYYLTTGGAARSGTWKLDRLWQYFISNEILAYHSRSQMILGKFITAAFVILFFYTLIREHLFTKEWRFWLNLKVHRNFFLLLCAAFFVIYLIAPDNMSGGSGMKSRLSFLPFLIIMPWLSWDMPKIAKGIASGILILLAVVHLTHTSYYHKIMSDDLEIYTSGYDVVERNKVILPLYSGAAGPVSRSWKGGNGGSWKIGVFAHSAGHYAYTKGCINLDNYEAALDYFPTVFKSDFHRLPVRVPDSAEYARIVDYVITWGLSSRSDDEARILEDYSLIKNNGNLKIFRRTTHDGDIVP